MGFTHEQIEEAIKVWQKRLRLQDWKFEVCWDEEPKTEGAVGCISQIPGRKYARLRFASSHIAEGTVSDVSTTIAHELLHMMLEPLGDVMELAMDGASTEKTLLMQRAWDNALELATDSLAEAFGGVCPPPDCLLEAEAVETDAEPDAEDEPLRVTG
jgi:hypothetical protein